MVLGIQWVMPKKVQICFLVGTWQELFDWHKNSITWNAVPLALCGQAGEKGTTGLVMYL